MATDDEPGSAPFIVAAVAGMDGLVDISSYWVFSDGALLLSCARVSCTIDSHGNASLRVVAR